MIRIIEGKRYNTETATKVCDCGSDGFSRGDFQWHDTGLYVTANGNWFLAGEGNALSMWARPSGQGGHRGSSGILPISKAEALEQLEAVNATEAIDKYFADAVKDA